MEAGGEAHCRLHLGARLGSHFRPASWGGAPFGGHGVRRASQAVRSWPCDGRGALPRLLPGPSRPRPAPSRPRPCLAPPGGMGGARRKARRAPAQVQPRLSRGCRGQEESQWSSPACAAFPRPLGWTPGTLVIQVTEGGTPRQRASFLLPVHAHPALTAAPQAPPSLSAAPQAAL